jgi:serine/threonine-protein kinase
VLRSRHGTTVVVFLLGVACTAVVVFWRVGHEEAAKLARLEQRGEEIAAALEKGLHAPLEVLAYVPPFFESSEYVSPEEFDSFTAPALARQPSVAAVEWAPRVLASEREAFIEDLARRFRPGFRIRRLDSMGELEPSPPRDEYLPLLYRNPRLEHVMGMDLLQRPEQLRAIERAVEAATPSVSSRFALIGDPRAQHAIAVFAPVYDSERPLETAAERWRALTGVATAILRIEPLVEDALSAVDLGLFDLRVVDRTASGESVELYPSAELAAAGVSTGVSASAPELVWSKLVPFQDRSWEVSIARRDMQPSPIIRALPLLAIGFLLSCVAAAGTGALSAIARLRHEVEAARQLGQYRIESRIGKGGMGTVYRARHSMLRRPTAVKVISADAVSERTLARFEREVRYTSELAHPNTIEIYDFGRTPEGVFYYAMEYIAGLSFDQLVVSGGPQPAARVLNMLCQASGALAEAHAKGLIHRDIKPANLMLCDRGGIADMVKVLDFGLVKQLASDTDPELSSVNVLMGTPLYMSPETISEPDAVDSAADVYALCAVGFYLLTGTSVFEGKTVVEICSKHLSEQPLAPSERLPGCSSPELDSLLLAGLAKSPQDRPANGGELLARLEAVSDIVEPWSQAAARAWWEGTGQAMVDSLEAEHTLIEEDDTHRAFLVDFDKRSLPRARS